MEELLAERGPHADHVTVWRWVQRYTQEMERRMHSRLKPTSDSWRVGETYIRVKGKWRYLYRAVDSTGATLDFLLWSQAGRGRGQALPEPKRSAQQTIRRRESSTLTSMPLTRRRLCNSKTRMFWRRTANTDLCSISITSSNRITGPSSAGSAPVKISGLSGELAHHRRLRGRAYDPQGPSVV